MWGIIVGMMTRPYDTEPLSRAALGEAIRLSDAQRRRRRRHEMKVKAAYVFIDAARRAWWKIGVICYVCTMLEINGAAAFRR